MTNQLQNQTPMEVDAEQLSPTSLCTQLTAYQTTVRNLHAQRRITQTVGNRSH